MTIQTAVRLAHGIEHDAHKNLGRALRNHIVGDRATVAAAIADYCAAREDVIELGALPLTEPMRLD